MRGHPRYGKPDSRALYGAVYTNPDLFDRVTVVSPWARAEYDVDICLTGPKGLGPSDIAPGLGWGFDRVLPWAPENRPQLGPGPGWG